MGHLLRVEYSRDYGIRGRPREGGRVFIQPVEATVKGIGTLVLRLEAGRI